MEPVVETDPARELAEMLVSLTDTTARITGADYLASRFEVTPYSQDFYRVITTILDRLDQLKTVIAEIPLDPDYRDEMIGHTDNIALAFGPQSLQSAWGPVSNDKLSAANIQPLKGLSGLVRQKIAYPKLNPDEIRDLIATVAELKEWLEQHQLAEQDFIRQALIEGLNTLTFRLSKFQWLGWGYTLASLREVIAAYMMLERQAPNPAHNPDAEAVLKKTGAVIKKVYDKLQAVKKVTETGDWVLKAYCGTALLIQGAVTVQGLLTHR